MIAWIMAATLHVSSSSISSTTFMAGEVVTTVQFPVAASVAGEIVLSGSSTIPSQLVVMGNDEREAFHGDEVLAYISMRVLRDIRLNGTTTLAFTLPRSIGIPGVKYQMSYRASDESTWTPVGSRSPVARGDAGYELYFSADTLPNTLVAGTTYSFVLYVSEGASG
ncbi:MAG TPA: hypothetical protein VMD47_05775 [Candidatus Acidoferrales bacterium]|nr:hypothetical protein [Candidatus Acidoferrales bacterium]